MRKNIFIVGKELPSSRDFAEVFTMGDFSVAITGESTNANSKISPDIKLIRWNKNSSISARSALIQAETECGFINDSILYFDAPYFASKFDSLSADVCAPACDSMILGFQYITFELIKRIEQHKTNSRIIFVLKTTQSYIDVLRTPSLRKAGTEPASAIVAAAEAAFANFAENMAATLLKNNYISTLLITGDEHNEVMHQDTTLASWLKDYINELDEKKTESKNIKWIKAGEKLNSGFSLFNKF